MVKERVIETNEGIQDELTVEIYDRFSKIMRDRGWNNVKAFIRAGINSGNVLEIGPGPGYAGLEWLKATSNSTITGCEISREMILLAEKNAKEYGLEARSSYAEGNCMQMPFQNGSFDAVFSNGSLHEWENPVKAFNEIYRVLKSNGQFFISDMRRDVNPMIVKLIYWMAKPKEIRPGFITSLNASYTVDEINRLLKQSALKNAAVIKDFFGLSISGNKEG